MTGSEYSRKIHREYDKERELGAVLIQDCTSILNCTKGIQVSEKDIPVKGNKAYKPVQ